MCELFVKPQDLFMILLKRIYPIVADKNAKMELIETLEELLSSQVFTNFKFDFLLWYLYLCSYFFMYGASQLIFKTLTTYQMYV